MLYLIGARDNRPFESDRAEEHDAARELHRPHSILCLMAFYYVVDPDLCLDGIHIGLHMASL